MTIKISGRIDSSNAAEVEKNINAQIGDFDGDIVLDAAELEYISSAGLRIQVQKIRSTTALK